ncbi:MAG: ABC transporter permease subunit, partial [Tenericutes bacterium]|nr:ABC transporter permease subunit [Mycoplasmatota bacterium]
INKILCGFLYIILMIAIIGIFNFIGLSLSGEFDRKSYILLSITPIFSSIVIFAVCLFLSTFTHKTKKTLGISLGIVFASYFLNIISEMGESTEFLKYISIFTLADIRNVIINEFINPLMIVLTIGITAIFMILTVINYEKKELV